MGLPNPSWETRFSGAKADRKLFIFLVQLTTSSIGKHTRLIHTPAICVIIHYIAKYQNYCSSSVLYEKFTFCPPEESIHDSTDLLIIEHCPLATTYQ